jgi:hypothetical protein
MVRTKPLQCSGQSVLRSETGFEVFHSLDHVTFTQISTVAAPAQERSRAALIQIATADALCCCRRGNRIVK